MIGELMYLASQAHYSNSGYDLSIGGTCAAQIEDLTKLAASPSRSWFHYSHFVVAEVDGQVMAGAAGLDASRPTGN